MKVALNKVINSTDSLKEIVKLKFKAKVAFALKRLLEACDVELKTYEDVRNSTVLKYSSDGKQVDQDKIPPFFVEMNELLAKEVDLPDLSLSEDDFDGLELSPGNILALDWLFKK